MKYKVFILSALMAIILSFNAFATEVTDEDLDILKEDYWYVAYGCEWVSPTDSLRSARQDGYAMFPKISSDKACFYVATGSDNSKYLYVCYLRTNGSIGYNYSPRMIGTQVTSRPIADGLPLIETATFSFKDDSVTTVLSPCDNIHISNYSANTYCFTNWQDAENYLKNDVVNNPINNPNAVTDESGVVFDAYGENNNKTVVLYTKIQEPNYVGESDFNVYQFKNGCLILGVLDGQYVAIDYGATSKDEFDIDVLNDSKPYEHYSKFNLEKMWSYVENTGVKYDSIRLVFNMEYKHAWKIHGQTFEAYIHDIPPLTYTISYDSYKDRFVIKDETTDKDLKNKTEFQRDNKDSLPITDNNSNNNNISYNYDGNFVAGIINAFGFADNGFVQYLQSILVFIPAWYWGIFNGMLLALVGITLFKAIIS